MNINVSIVTSKATGIFKNMVSDTNLDDNTTVQISQSLPNKLVYFLKPLNNKAVYIKNIENAVNSIVGIEDFFMSELDQVNYLSQCCAIYLMFDFLEIVNKIPTCGLSEREKKVVDMVIAALQDNTCHCMIFKLDHLTDGASIYGLKMEITNVIDSLGVPMRCDTIKPPKYFPEYDKRESYGSKHSCCNSYYAVKKKRISPSCGPFFLGIVLINKELHKEYKRIFEGQYTDGGKFRVRTSDPLTGRVLRTIAEPDYFCKNIILFIMQEWPSFKLDIEYILENIKKLPETYQKDATLRISSQLSYNLSTKLFI
jgi:hypothetical protein